MSARISRRDFVRLGGAAAVAGALSSCTSSATTSPSTSASHTAVTSSPVTSGGTSAAVSGSARPAVPTFRQLAAQVSGGVTRKGQHGFDPAALLYNPRFGDQATPEAIAACRTAADVAACVRFAAAGGATLRIRNGGHSYGGWSSGTGLVANLAAMKQVRVDHRAMTAQVGAGALLADVYAALAAQSVSIGAGSCPTVGVTGLTLGGGVGVLARAYGLTCDQVASFAVVTADGRIRTVDVHSDPDLFMALRGGGGSFAAVTSLTFRVRPAPRISTFFLQWAWSEAADVLASWQQWVAGTPRELWSTCKLLGDPASGLKVTVSGTWIGSSSLDAVLSGLLGSLPRPIVNSRNAGTYGAVMAAEAGCESQNSTTCIARARTPAIRAPFAASSSVLQNALPAAGVHAGVDAVAAGLDIGRGVLIEAGISFDSLGGAVGDVAPGATAFPWRHALALVQHTATWKSSSATVNPAPFDRFVRGARHALTPWAGDAAYVNYADASIVGFGTAYWGKNLAALQHAKSTYDPHDVFHFPQSVRG